jgi:hypothetical protein
MGPKMIKARSGICGVVRALLVGIGRLPHRMLINWTGAPIKSSAVAALACGGEGPARRTPRSDRSGMLFASRKVK